MHGVHAHARARAVLWHVRVMACCELFEARLPTEGKRVANNNNNGHDFNFAVCVPLIIQRHSSKTTQTSLSTTSQIDPQSIILLQARRWERASISRSLHTP